MKADSLLSIEIKPPPEKFEYKTPIEMDHNNRSKTILKLHTYIWISTAPQVVEGWVDYNISSVVEF